MSWNSENNTYWINQLLPQTLTFLIITKEKKNAGMLLEDQLFSTGTNILATQKWDCSITSIYQLF